MTNTTTDNKVQSTSSLIEAAGAEARAEEKPIRASLPVDVEVPAVEGRDRGAEAQAVEGRCNGERARAVEGQRSGAEAVEGTHRGVEAL